MKKKTFNFWKPIRHKKPLKLKPKKDLTWKEAKRRYPKLKPFGDADRDGKKNKFDCKPFDKKRHSIMQRNEIAGLFSTPRVLTTVKGKKINTNFPTRKELEYEMRGQYGKNIPPKKEIVLLNKKHIIRVLEKNPDIVSKLKRSNVKLEFKNPFDAVHANLPEEDDYFERRSLAEYSPYKQVIRINPIRHHNKKHHRSTSWEIRGRNIRFSDPTPEETIRHEVEHIRQFEGGLTQKQYNEYKEEWEEEADRAINKRIRKNYEIQPEALQSLNIPKDSDGDLVVDKADCEPYNPDKQGFLHMINPDSKKSMKRFERYKPQVQRTTAKLEKQFVEDKEKIEREMHKWRNRPDLMDKKVKPLIHKRQQEDVGFFDYASIPGIEQRSEKIKWVKGKSAPLYLIVEKGVVKGELLTRKISPDTVEIRNLYVNPEYRNEGIGKKAIQAVFKNKQTKRIVGVAIPGSKEYWEKMGGKHTGSKEEETAYEYFLDQNVREAGLPMKYRELPTPLRMEVKKIADDMGSSFEIDKEEFQNIPQYREVEVQQPEPEVLEKFEPEEYEK